MTTSILCYTCVDVYCSKEVWYATVIIIFNTGATS